jgi:CheY-like chemotaxis protein
MEDCAWLGDGMAMPRWLESELESLGRPTILLVEDEGDIRHLLITLLGLAGFDTVARGTAEEGLVQLREQQFDLVLTDYMLPQRTGAWLLQQASAEGLLHATPAMVVTAHPNPGDLEGFEIVRKPFDLDDLVERVRRRLGEGAPPRPSSRAAGPPASGKPQSGGNGSNGHDDCPDPIELILYVSAHSPRSKSAMADIKRALKQYKTLRVNLTVHDLSEDPAKGEADAIAFTPTLAKRSPGPQTFILGHITTPELLLEMLDACEEH